MTNVIGYIKFCAAAHDNAKLGQLLVWKQALTQDLHGGGWGNY